MTTTEFLNLRKNALLDNLSKGGSNNTKIIRQLADITLAQGELSGGGSVSLGTGVNLSVDLTTVTGLQEEGISLLGASTTAPAAGSVLDRLDQVVTAINNINTSGGGGASTPDYYSDDFGAIIGVLGLTPTAPGAALIDKVDSLSAIAQDLNTVISYVDSIEGNQTAILNLIGDNLTTPAPGSLLDQLFKLDSLSPISADLTTIKTSVDSLESYQSTLVNDVSSINTKIDTIGGGALPEMVFNNQILDAASQVYSNVYGFKVFVNSGTVDIAGITYPVSGSNGKAAGFAIMDSIKIATITIDATNGSCLVQWLTEVT